MGLALLVLKVHISLYDNAHMYVLHTYPPDLVDLKLSVEGDDVIRSIL